MLKGIRITVLFGLAGLADVRTEPRQRACTTFAGLGETSAWNTLETVPAFVRETEHINL